MNEGRPVILPIVLLMVFALSRWPDLMPPNFSAAYGLAFCAGAYFRGSWAWIFPLGTLFLSDILINVLFYHTDALNPYMAINYLAYILITCLGRGFSARSSWWSFCAGGLLSGLIFHLVTNTFSWFQNPEYAKTVAGWIQALTIGTPGWPHTWEFFRNTLFSGALFAGLFAGALKLDPATEREPVADPESESAQSEPEEEEVAPSEAKPPR